MNEQDWRTRIRRAGEGDAAALAEFGRRTFEATFADQNRPEDTAAYVAGAYGVPQQRAEMLDPDWITLLLEVDGAIAAFAQVQRADPPAAVTGPAPVELRRFYVDAPHHGRGVAQALMTAAHAAARELGGRTLWLSSWERNPRAIAFYRKAGFTEVGTATFVVGSDPQTDHIMEAPVRPAD